VDKSSVLIIHRVRKKALTDFQNSFKQLNISAKLRG